MKSVILSCILVFVASSFAVGQDCALAKYDSIFVKDCFENTVRKVKKHLRPVLSDKEKALLDKTNFVISTSEDRTAVRSFSDKHTVVIGETFLFQLVRFQIAKTIDEQSILNRKRIGGLFSDAFFYISPDAQPTELARLNCKQINALSKAIETNRFQGRLIELLAFVFSHEFAHQTQEIDKKLRKINKYGSEEKKQKKRIALEVEADQYAIDKMVRMNLCPTAGADCLSMLSSFESKNTNGYNLCILRLHLAYKFIYQAAQCERLGGMLCTEDNGVPRYDCKKLGAMIEGSELLYENSIQMRRAALIKVDSSSAYSAYNFGDFYLKGTESVEKDINTAIANYRYLSKINPNAGPLYGTRDVKQLADIVEYGRLMLGLIYQFRLGQKVQAADYYRSAATIGTFLSMEHYQSLIKGCQ